MMVRGCRGFGNPDDDIDGAFKKAKDSGELWGYLGICVVCFGMVDLMLFAAFQTLNLFRSTQKYLPSIPRSSTPSPLPPPKIPLLPPPTTRLRTSLHLIIFNRNQSP